MSAFVSQNFLNRTGGVVDPVKIFFSPCLITVQNLVVMCHTVCAYLGVVLFGLIATAVGHELFKHMCHHTEFGRCMSNRMGVSGPKTSDTLRLRRFVMGVSD